MRSPAQDPGKRGRRSGAIFTVTTQRQVLKPILYFMALCGLVLMSAWFLYKNIFAPIIKAQLNFHPEIILNHVTGKSFDESGKIKSRFSAPKLFYYSKTKQTKIINPHIIMYSKKEKPWIITANHGEILNGNKIYKLSDHVKLRQQAGKKNADSTITTSELTLFPGKKMAQTDQAVTFVQRAKDNSTTIIKSIGMRAYQPTGVIHLLSHMSGTYVPNKKPQHNIRPNHEPTHQ